MSPLVESGESSHPSIADVPWPGLAPEQALSIMSMSAPTFLLGIHVIQGVLGTFQLPTFIQTLSKDKPNGQGDRLFTLPPNVINVDDFKRFTPRKRHLKPHKLIKRLGNDFDSFWMSPDLPDDLLETHIKHKLDNSLYQQIKSLNLTALDYTLQTQFGTANSSGDDAGDGSDETSGILSLVISWLVQTASCPVYYRWEDLGLLYWPRWVRRGMCSLNDTPLFKLSSDSVSKLPKFSSCSWPPGMHCVPAQAKRLRILRWQCRHNKALNNFNRFRLHGVITPQNLPTTSRQDTKKSQLSSNNQNSMKHHQVGVNVTQYHFTRFKKHINADTRKQRNKRDNSRIISDRAMNSKNENGQTRTNKKKDFDYQEKWKYSTSIPGGVKQAEDSDNLRGEVKGKKHDEVDGNDTENWNRMSWKQRRKSLDIKCKWIKIPYPVTDNCFCSC